MSSKSSVGSEDEESFVDDEESTASSDQSSASSIDENKRKKVAKCLIDHFKNLKLN